MRTIPAEPASAPRPMATSPISLRSVCFAAVITTRVWAAGGSAAARRPFYAFTRAGRGCGAAAGGHRLLDVGDDIFGRLDTDRETHEIVAHARLELLLRGELRVRGGRRMDDQRLGVADVGHVREQPRALHEAATGLAAALDAEADHRTIETAVVVLLRQGVRVVRRQARVAHPADFRMALEEPGHAVAVRAVTLHAQRQRLEPLQEEEGVER